jgi:hypothetical protein
MNHYAAGFEIFSSTKKFTVKFVLCIQIPISFDKAMEPN